MTKLYQHGIQDEDANIRAHVCPLVKRVYVYESSAGIEAIEKGDYQLVTATQKNVDGVTAEGYPVPVDDIPGCVELRMRPCTWESLNFPDDRSQLSTSERGKRAVSLVEQMIEAGRFVFPSTTLCVDVKTDIEGTDIKAKVDGRTFYVQVKCDYPGGRKEICEEVTGNLFLQIAERNPLNKHDGESKIQGV